MKVRLTEVYNEDNELTHIEVRDADNNKFVIQILWDPNDEQNPDTRAAFRTWANTMLTRYNLVPIN